MAMIASLPPRGPGGRAGVEDERVEGWRKEDAGSDTEDGE